jgi:FkbM family methyltransferase
MLNFSKLSANRALGRALRYPLRAIPKDVILPILQGRLRGARWMNGSSNHGCWLGSYEWDMCHIFEKTVQPNDIVFDVGAHVGYYTLLSAVLIGNRGHVFAFEPFPRNLDYLRRHMLLNRITNVTILDCAVTDASGEIGFVPGPTTCTGHVAATGSLNVRAISLDDLFVDRVIPMPNVIKIDVEGAELAVLRGAAGLLAEGRPTIFLSTHGEACTKNPVINCVVLVTV